MNRQLWSQPTPPFYLPREIVGHSRWMAGQLRPSLTHMCTHSNWRKHWFYLGSEVVAYRCWSTELPEHHKNPTPSMACVLINPTPSTACVLINMPPSMAGLKHTYTHTHTHTRTHTHTHTRTHTHTHTQKHTTTTVLIDKLGLAPPP